MKFKERLPERDKAEMRVERWKNFVATKERPSPSWISADWLDDVAAVVAGTKPAALIGKAADDEPEELKELFNLAKQTGYVVKEVKGFDASMPLWVVGNADSVEKIIALFDVYTERDDVDENYHRALGRYLGYPEDAIEKFLEKIRARNVDRIP